MLDIDYFDNIKRLAIIAMFSDDDLMDILVLKGGNALDIIHKIAMRASIDLDFSVENEFEKNTFNVVQEKISTGLTNTFRSEGFEAFDIRFTERPELMSPDTPDFWGGYQIHFKVIRSEIFSDLSSDINNLRRNALVVGPNNVRSFKIEISKHEYCQRKQEFDLDGYTIYVYTPEMIVFEKLRAICQQMPEYATITKKRTSSARARDFFDIYSVLSKCDIDLISEENKKLLECIFAAKKVPLPFIGKIHEYREYHRPDFSAVQATVKRMSRS
jgi:predicted nucleotidyltransferase component of viral defense system